MAVQLKKQSSHAVAPREGRVSRNWCVVDGICHLLVAPREGRVSRNLYRVQRITILSVAPREGRVSRNAEWAPGTAKGSASRPARGV